MGLPFLYVVRGAFAILLGAATASSYLSCANASEGPLLPPPENGPRVDLHIESLGTSRPEKIDPDSGPGFKKCLTTLAESRYKQEFGVRLRICFPEIERILELKEQWATLDTTSRRLGEFKTGTSVDLLDTLKSKSIEFFYDGNGRQALAELNRLHGRSTHSILASRFIDDPRRNEILLQYSNVALSPRKFPDSVFSFVLTKHEIYLLFPSRFRRRIHWLSVPLESVQADRLRTKLIERHEALLSLLEDRTDSAAFNFAASLTELFDRRQFEFQCSRDGLLQFRFKTDNRSYERVLPCLKNAILLLRRKPENRISYIQDSQSSIDVPYIADGRSLNWQQKPRDLNDSDSGISTNGYWSLEPCNPECNSLGFHTAKKKFSMPRCRLEDIELNEWNLIGLLTPGLEPGGKFLEFRIHRNCRSAGLKIYVDQKEVLFPAKLQKGLHLMLADPSYFDRSNRFTSQASHLVRNISEGDEIILKCPACEKSKTLKKARNPDLFLFGESIQDADVNAIQSRKNTGKDQFHPPYCRGLIPDLCRSGVHGMSPGEEVRPRPLPTITLDEILPAGTSDPAEEFLEFRSVDSSSDSKFVSGSLRIQFQSENRSYVFYGAIPRSDSGRWAIMREGNQCYSETPSVIQDSDFRIPNQPFRLEVRLKAHTAEGKFIDKTLLREDFSKSFLNRQFSHVRRENRKGHSRWMVHSDSQCHNSTPGRPGYYRPQFRPLGLHFFKIQWLADSDGFFQWQNDNDSSIDEMAWISPGRTEVVLDHSENRFASEYTIRLKHLSSPEALRIAGPNLSDERPLQSSRKFRIWPSQKPDRSCVVQSIQLNTTEWIRVCFPQGSTESIRLAISDEQSRDTLIPAGQRRNDLSLYEDPSSLRPGECALILDPDINKNTLESIQQPADQMCFMPESGSALGNGLRKDEEIEILLLDSEHLEPEASDRSPLTLCTYGAGNPENDYLIPENHRIIERKEGTYQDLPENFEFGRLL
ncbi:MAG: hypothetical protein RH862_13280 [Leptospiraceae bacterium]